MIKIKVALFVLILLALFGILTSCDNSQVNKTYNLELKRWKIYNNGTHPVETTKGFNNAIKWASANGYTKIKVKKGTYLISKGIDKNDKNNAINMVSNMVLLLDHAVLKKEPNNYQGYSIIYFGNVNNAGIIGGKLIGDRDEHDYSKPKDELTTNTHEWGNAINTKGSSNITISDVYIKGTTGDGLELGASVVDGTQLTKFENGSIDDKGKPIRQKDKIRTVGRIETNFDNKIYSKYKNFYMWLPEGKFKSKLFDVYFYNKEGKLLKFQKSLEFYRSEAKIPHGADYFKAVFDADNTNVKIQRKVVDLSKNITINNVEIDNTRRQGISLVGTKDITISNNYIHDVRGTSPQSGIDIEPGYFTSVNTIIKGNKFVNNPIQIVLTYGQKCEISNNYFEKGLNGSIGVYSYESFKELTVNNNTFNGSGFITKTNNAKMDSNKFKNNSSVVLSGNDQLFTNAKFLNSKLSVGIGKNQIISNVEMELDKFDLNALSIGIGKVKMKNISINKGKSNNNITKYPIVNGIGSNENTYDNFKIYDSMQHGFALPAGKFTNFHLDVGTISFNRKGNYALKDGVVKSDSNLVSVNSLYGFPIINFDNVKFEQRGNTVYGASIYVQGVKQFTMQNSGIIAANNTSEIPFIKFGVYGTPPNNTKIFGVDFKNVTVKTKQGMKLIGIDSTNAGKDAPPYKFENVKMYNSEFKLKENDENINGKVINE